MNIAYRVAPPTPAKVEAPRTSLPRLLRARLFRRLTHRLEMRRAWLALPAEVRLVLRQARLRPRLVGLASPQLLVEATERVAAAVRYERAVEAYRKGPKITESGRPTPRPLPEPLWIQRTREPSDMQCAVACSATSVPEAVEALREGLLEYVVMQVICGR